MGTGYHPRAMQVSWNEIVVMGHNFVNVLNTTESFTLKWSILCSVNFTPVKNIKK